MGDKTDISWADRTLNGWIGCTKVSPACDNCYAAVSRPTTALGVSWGAGQPRHRTSAANWKLPLRWNEKLFYECKKCLKRGDESDFKNHRPFTVGNDVLGCDGTPTPTRQRVFCASLSDWLDNEVPVEWLVDLLDLIRRTPNIDWLLLTKRIGRLRDALDNAMIVVKDQQREHALYKWLLDWIMGKPPANVWIGATICNQAEADRDVPKLLRVPAAVRFLSIEPMLGPVNLKRAIWGGVGCGACHQWGSNPRLFKRRVCTTCDRSEQQIRDDHGFVLTSEAPQIHQIITGGESGANARPSNPQWFRDIRDQCAAAGTSYHHKQNGEFLPADADECDAGISEKLLVWSDGQPWCREDGQRGGVTLMARVGKKTAGCLLDGRIHHELPESRHV